MSNQKNWLAFPDDFTWGAATASFQVEGAAHEDGRGPSIWDTFCRTPGKVVNGDTGDVACDHYHRYAEDVELMSHLGLQAYRFSIAWPRILPTGTGQINQAGLDFYDRLVDALLAKGITPYATLYHWDLPQPLQDAGGWPDRMIVDAFVHYTDVVSKRLGDRVHNWMTHNEPWVVAFLGYALGHHAPGFEDFPAALAAAHHLLVSHGQAVAVLRSNGSEQTRVGIVTNLSWADPATDSDEDRAAARRWDGFHNRWFLDPLFKGSYPADMVDFYGDMVPGLQAGDMDLITAPIDFLGVNYYTRAVVRADEASMPPLKFSPVKPEGDYTAMDWEIHPASLYSILDYVHTHYVPKAIYITENGAAFEDEVAADGKVYDPRRQAFYAGYIASVHRALQAGIPIKGYFAWSLMDNFEWAFGYTRRFGITYVDYETQQRIPKQSAEWYAQVIANKGYAL